MKIHSYKKHIIDENGNSKIGYYVDNKFQKFVNYNKPDYLKWLYDNNYQVPEIPYIAPVPPTVEEKRQTVINMIMNNRNKAFNSGIEYNSNHFDSGSMNREMMIAGDRKAKKAKKNNQTITAKVITSNGSIALLDQDDMIALLELFDDLNFDINNQSSDDYEKTLTALESELDYYIANNQYN